MNARVIADQVIVDPAPFGGFGVSVVVFVADVVDEYDRVVEVV